MRFVGIVHKIGFLISFYTYLYLLLSDQLDGFSRKRKRSLSIDDSSEISLTDYLNRQEKKLNKPGKKRVCT